MAKWILFNDEGNLVKLARTDAAKDAYDTEGYTAKSVSDSVYKEVALGEKDASYDSDSDTISYTTHQPEITSATDFKTQVDNRVAGLNDWLNRKSGHAEVSNVTAAKNALTALNVTTIFNGVTSSDAWYGQTIASDSRGYNDEDELTAEINAGNVTESDITRTACIKGSVEKYLDLNSSAWYALSELPK